MADDKVTDGEVRARSGGLCQSCGQVDAVEVWRARPGTAIALCEVCLIMAKGMREAAQQGRRFEFAKALRRGLEGK